MSLPRRVLLLQVVFASLLLLLCCQELRASVRPHIRIRPDPEPKYLWGLKDAITQHGTPTTTIEWPWIAALYEKSNVSDSFEAAKFVCGGVLVTRDHVLTAAHCLYDKETEVRKADSKFQVALGQYNLSDRSERPNRRFKISRTILHERYNGSSASDHDIAILVLQGEAIVTSTVRPVRLWDFGANLTSCTGTVVGWSKEDDNNGTTEIPTKVLMKTTANRQCRATDRTLQRLVSNVTFCAHGLKYYSGPCSGDSGSGLFFSAWDEVGQERWMVRGIVSKGLTKEQDGIKVCDLTKPVVFTDLLAVSDWIQTHTMIRSRSGNPLRVGGDQVWQCSAAWQSNPRIRELSTIPEKDWERKLLESSAQGNLEMVQLLVQAGVDVTARTYVLRGLTALHLAAEAGHAEIVRELLRAGANLTATDWDDYSPLHHAAFYGPLEVVRILLEEGADPDLPDRLNITALHLAAEGGHLAVVELLLNNSVDCEAQGDRPGCTPLYLAARLGHTSTVRYLAERGCNVNFAKSGGETPLHEAAGQGDVETVRALVELGAGIKIQDGDGETPLHWAAKNGYVETVRTLVGLGAGINMQNNNGDTPLHLAVKNNKIDTVRAIAYLGANLNVKNNRGKTPLTIANFLEIHGAEDIEPGSGFGRTHFRDRY